MIDNIEHYIFDFDGVVTNTASIHFRAWKMSFEALLPEYCNFSGKFQLSDYLNFVDGQSRRDGIQSYLAHVGCKSNEIIVNVISEIKNAHFRDIISNSEVDDIIFNDAIGFIEHLRSNGKICYVASSSKNVRLITKKCSLDKYFHSVYDGNTIDEKNLRSKPSPDIFDYVIELNGIDPKSCCIFEDSIMGVRAAVASKSDLVYGINRKNKMHQSSLEDAGASNVIECFEEIS